MDGPWRIEYYRDPHGREPFRTWVDDLPPDLAQAVADAIDERLTRFGPGICRDHWGRSLGGGLYEMRIRRREVSLRVFFGAAKERVVIVLGGFDTGSNPKRQRAAIAIARSRLADHRQRVDRI